MGGYVDLLTSLPKTQRDIKARAEARTLEIVAEAKKFGKSYFDGTREQGYGGYHYDGRWQQVAKDIISYFKLPPSATILDIGCAKGFLVKDFITEKMDAYGIDVSHYALLNALPEVKHRLYLCNKDSIHFLDKHFDLAVSINTIHNLPRDGVIRMLKEIQRVSHRSYIVVDAYTTPEEKAIFESWQLTAETHAYPDEWLQIFKEAGYTGHFSWNIMS